VRSRRRLAGVSEQVARVDANPRGKSLDGPQRQVPLTSLECTHVGAVHAEDRGEGFLGEAALRAVGAEVASDGALEVAFHPLDLADPLLDGLHTDE
jgi:hypothetical protein